MKFVSDGSVNKAGFAANFFKGVVDVFALWFLLRFDYGNSTGAGHIIRISSKS